MAYYRKNSYRKKSSRKSKSNYYCTSSYTSKRVENEPCPIPKYKQELLESGVYHRLKREHRELEIKKKQFNKNYYWAIAIIYIILLFSILIIDDEILHDYVKLITFLYFAFAIVIKLFINSGYDKPIELDGYRFVHISYQEEKDYNRWVNNIKAIEKEKQEAENKKREEEEREQREAERRAKKEEEERKRQEEEERKRQEEEERRKILFEQQRKEAFQDYAFLNFDKEKQRDYFIEIKKSKSDYLKYLFEHQVPDRDIIKTRECLRHKSNDSINYEDAYIFTLGNNNLYHIVYENVNEGTSSIRYTLYRNKDDSEKQYYDIIATLRSYMGGRTVNKREGLHSNKKISSAVISIVISLLYHKDYYKWKNSFWNSPKYRDLDSLRLSDI